MKDSTPDTLASLILSRFRGRADTVAVGDSPTSFHPERENLTAEGLEQRHLAGSTCLGFYVLDQDSCCWCTCVDFDNKPDHPDPEWRDKAEKLYVVLAHLHLTPLIEVSQSGTGCHVWLFFDGPTPAWVPRAWWRELSAKIEVPFKETYPRQDALTGKGLGNLVRYPLWGQSCFVDVECGWEVIAPVDALRSIRTTSETDLKLLAFQTGMGELVGEPRSSIVVDVGSTLGELLPLRVQKLVERAGTLLHRRWQGDGRGMKDQSTSSIAMSIATELVRQYVPTAEIGSALRYWMRQNGSAKKGDRDDWVNLTVTKAYDFVVERVERKSTDATTLRAACHLYIDRIEKGQESYLGSGIGELDASIDGIGEGEVCVIAARPGHGKSAIAFQWSDNAAVNGIPGLVISEEMSATEIGKRRLLSISDIPHEQWVAATAAHLREQVDTHHAGQAPVYVVEGCNTIDRAEEVIDQFCTLHGVGFVAVDYLQLIGSRSADRYEVVTEVSRRIKQVTSRNRCRTLLLSQLNRQVESRPDYEPKMSDLRESGGIEQDADLILFAQWPCKFDSEAPEDEYRIIAAKRRNGPIRSARIDLKFNASRQTFGNKDPFGVPRLAKPQAVVRSGGTVRPRPVAAPLTLDIDDGSDLPACPV